MAVRIRDRSCAYCGAPPPSERDHVPPRGLFGGSLPSNMLTVPACAPCHRSTSEDDEYFRRLLTWRAGMEHRPGVGAVADRAMRGFLREERRAEQVAFARSARLVDLVDEAGVAREELIIEPDYPRLDRVPSRIMRGLYYLHVGSPVPAAWSVVPWSADRTAVRGGSAAAEYLRRTLSGMAPQEVGEGVFRYRLGTFDRPDGVVAIAALVFYEAMEWLMLVGPHEPKITGWATSRDRGGDCA